MAVQEPLVPHNQVFLNFRGEELRNGFVSYLVTALKNAGINVFIDKHERRGEDLTVLFRRIEESKIVLVVFSRRYMESKWCLNELAKIKECVDEKKLVAIPIFFKVNPSELKSLLYEAHNESHGNVQPHIMEKWKVALKCIKSKMGLTLEEQSDEADFVKAVVAEVMKWLSTIPCSLEGEEKVANLFGIEHRIEQVEERFGFDHSDETRIVGIVGMPGIGKTTLATELFKRYENKFIRCVNFLKIRMEMGSGHLRMTFLKDLLPKTNITDKTTYDCLKTELLKNKVFVVLDSVSRKKHIKALLGDRSWIKKGSRIVITTRDRALIADLDPNPYVVPRLNPRDGLMYFSFFALGGFNPEMGDYMKMSRVFVDYVRGNPKALRELGKELRGKGETLWKAWLDTLAICSKESIKKLLKISYDELSEKEKDAFLDIACFFRSEDEFYARSLLDSGGQDESSEVASEITNLAYKFLISISGGRLEMHDLLHTFAIEHCSLSSTENTCRLWKYEDIIAALHGKMGTKTVRGISLDMSQVMDMPLEFSVFAKMCNLRYLKFYTSTCPRECEGDCKLNFPDGLSLPLEKVRYLDWLKFPLDELPSDLNPNNLVDLRLPYSKIKQVWKDSKDTPKLKWVDLNNSRKLQTLSGFSKAPNLLRLNLEGCTSLECLSDEMQTMESLVFLNLRGCTSLLHLPQINLSSLKILILSGCAKLHKFQLISENIESLYLDGTAIEDLPSDTVKLQRLILLNLKECKRLRSLPECIGKLKALEELILSGCSNLETFPNVEDNMENFRILLLDGTSILEVPKILPGIKSLLFLRRLSFSGNGVISSLGYDISQMYHLKWLDLRSCEKLRSLSTLPPNLQWLDAHGCISLQTVSSPLAFIMQTEEIHNTFTFTNCGELNEAAKNEIASHVRRKCQLSFISTCYPGYEVPEWFSHQAYGSVLEPKLPPHWCDNKFLGIYLCAIVSFRDCGDRSNRILANCTCEFEDLDAPCSRFSVPVENEPRNIESDHVFISYISRSNIKKRQEVEFKEGCVPTRAVLRFKVTDGAGEEIPQCEVVKCGFGLVYEPDDEVSNVVSLVSARTRMIGESSQGEVTTFQSAEEAPIETPKTADSTSENIFY
ncbi:hypothetical protein Bca52824_030895 [Brassica carinata]|uniref:ADP-ribosyl cyclase/cyclic ADP-ribose hydrolase n=1 Tax=Brassica carinata TaxID=52824 RepID=A0A8X7SE35_BRACI|nr:hypothetical protein Bca52824_030895 [Brassica carinata]